MNEWEKQRYAEMPCLYQLDDVAVSLSLDVPYISAWVCLSAEKDLLEDIWSGVFTDMRHALLWTNKVSSIARRFLEIPFSAVIYGTDMIYIDAKSKWRTIPSINRHEQF